MYGKCACSDVIIVKKKITVRKDSMLLRYKSGGKNNMIMLDVRLQKIGRTEESVKIVMREGRGYHKERLMVLHYRLEETVKE